MRGELAEVRRRREERHISQERKDRREDRSYEKHFHQVAANNFLQVEDESEKEICRRIYTMYRRHCAHDSQRMPKFRTSGFKKANLGIEWIQKENYD